MPKVAITEIQSLQNEQVAVARINANFVAIQSVIDTLLSRDGTAPNQMVALLDMNGRALVNLPQPVNPNDAARFKEIQDFYALVIEERERAEAAADAAEGFRDGAQIQAGVALGHAQAAAGKVLEAEAEAIRSENAADRSEDEADRSEQEANRSRDEANRAEVAAELLEVYEISLFVEKTLWPSETLLSLVSARNFTFETDTSDSVAVALIPATNNQVISLKKNGSEFGTIGFAATATQGVVTVNTETSFDPGDVFTMTIDTADTSLGNIAISLQTRRNVVG